MLLFKSSWFRVYGFGFSVWVSQGLVLSLLGGSGDLVTGYFKDL